MMKNRLRAVFSIRRFIARTSSRITPPQGQVPDHICVTGESWKCPGAARVEPPPILLDYPLGTEA
jgi:hypothetical protein